MARAIIRYSVSGERSHQTGNAVRHRLEEAGFDRGNRTAALEVDGAPLADIVAALKDVLDQLNAPLAGGELDHVWIYVDHAGLV